MKRGNSYIAEALTVEGIPMDDYGDKVGISDKSDSATVNKTEQPLDGPIRDISKSAYANVNVPTRQVPRTDNGNLGCAAAVSVIFYRATGYTIIPNKKIELSTGAMWDYLDSASDRFQKITNWSSDYKPGDIIITKRGSRPGHVGVVVEGGKIMSNSSGGFQGDRKGQIELNYTISSWNSVARRNPTKTAIFRYIGPYRDQWGGEGTVRPGESQTISAEDSELAYGSTGPEVLKMQNALISSGYNLPKYGADGKFFAETRGALKTFQRDRGIAETGRLDAKTREQLFLKSEDGTVRQPTDIIGKKFKIFDNEKRKVVVAKVENDGTITIKSRIGIKLGSATMADDKITVEYDGKTMEATEQSENQVARSIYRIFNRMKGAIISGQGRVQTPVLTPSPEQTDFIKLESTKNFELVAQKGAQIANKLVKDLGINKETAAGIVGNLWAESGLIPDRIQGAGTKRGTITQAGGGGYAWAQYTSPDLKEEFKNHAKAKGLDISTQPANDSVNYSFLVQWISSRASKLSDLRSKKTTRDAAEYFVRKFEKPYAILYGSTEEQNKVITTRTAYANTVLSRMDGSRVQTYDQLALTGKPKVLFLGDSQTAASYSYANSLINDGTVTGKVVSQGGASTYVLRQMLRDELMKGEKYDAVSILAGGNDAWRDDPRAAIDNLKSMYQTIKNAGMKVIAVSNPTKKFAESPGSSKKKYPSNDEIASWVEAGGDGLIDSIVPLNSRTKDTLTAFSGDKIHLSGAGHAVAKSLWKESALA